MRYYATLGPACEDAETLDSMFREGITGMRLNLSHGGLQKNAHLLTAFRRAAEKAGLSGITPELLIDLQGPELRVGDLGAPLSLQDGERVWFYPEKGNPKGKKAIPLPSPLLCCLQEGDSLLLDDGRLLLRIEREGDQWSGLVLRGGTLLPHKSAAVEGREIPAPVLTETDWENLRLAGQWGVTGVMQPFVRGPEDLRELRRALDEAGLPNARIFAKIESLSGAIRLKELLPFADEIVIARGDLGNSMPLWQLPAAQKRIARICKEAGKPFMVVTQLLDSMGHSAVPTRAEVSDIFNAVLDGASSLMVTGETAAGKFPQAVCRYLVKTAEEALLFQGRDSMGEL